jgi:cell division protein FtsA
MDTRIGYPTEHLAENVPEEMAHPMYSTGVGLVIRGLQHNKRRQKPEDGIANHSKKQKGSFFDSLFKKGKQFFDEEDLK